MCLAAILAALMILAGVETVAMVEPIELGSEGGRFGTFSAWQVIPGGLLLLGPVKAELFLRN